MSSDQLIAALYQRLERQDVLIEAQQAQQEHSGTRVAAKFGHFWRREAGRDVVSCPACGCRIWLVDQVVDPFSAQLELAVMGLPAQLVAFRPARGQGVFRDAGGVVTPPGCGSCIGNGPGVPGAGETTVSTTNRNYDRRMGAPGPVFLASPTVAAASARTGRLTDPRAL